MNRTGPGLAAANVKEIAAYDCQWRLRLFLPPLDDAADFHTVGVFLANGSFARLGFLEKTNTLHSRAVGSDKLTHLDLIYFFDRRRLTGA